MIRKNSLSCKLFHIKISSAEIFISLMKNFHPRSETCPICGSSGNCHILAYYDRSLTDFVNGRRITSSLCIRRVYCDSCKHSHAILPDIIVPYSTFSILFVLNVLGDYFTGLLTVEKICERYDISINTFYKWLALWRSHKQAWLGVLQHIETDDLSFWNYLRSGLDYSDFATSFFLQTDHSFLQSHKNPVPIRGQTADL